MSYADKLRKLADWLDEHDIYASMVDGEWDYPSLAVYAEDAVQFGTIVGNMGKVDKDGWNGTLSAEHISRPNPHAGCDFRVAVSVSDVCEARVTDQTKVRRIHLPVVPDGARWNADGNCWEVDEPVVEYDCPKSFLGLAAS